MGGKIWHSLSLMRRVPGYEQKGDVDAEASAQKAFKDALDVYTSSAPKLCLEALEEALVTHGAVCSAGLRTCVQNIRKAEETMIARNTLVVLLDDLASKSEATPKAVHTPERLAELEECFASAFDK